MSKYSYTTLFAALSVLNRSSKASAKLRGERRGEEVGKHEIDVEFLTNLWEKQKGLCYYSNIPMNYNKAEWRISIERLDNSKGYIPENVVLCCLEFNVVAQWTLQKVDEIFLLQTKQNEQPFMNFIEIHKLYLKQKIPYVDTPRGRFNKFIVNAHYTSKKRNEKGRDHTCSITMDDLIELYENQKGLCAYSGIPLQFGSYLNQNWNVSLERLDPMQGYTKENIALICMEFNSCDQTVKTGPEYGSAGWNPLKYDYFMAHVKHKKGEISDEELQATIELQEQFKTYTNQEIVKEYRVKIYHRTIENGFKISHLTHIKQIYGAIYSITSPSGKIFIDQTEVLFQTNSSIFAKMRKYRYKLITQEIDKYGQDAMKIEKLVSCKKEDLDKYKEYFIDALNTREPHGLNPKKTVSRTTREQIADTMITNTVRFSHDNKELPKYVKYIDWKDRRGYAIVSHPNCKIKYFVSKNKPLEDLYTNCMEYLSKL